MADNDTLPGTQEQLPGGVADPQAASLGPSAPLPGIPADAPQAGPTKAESVMVIDPSATTAAAGQRYMKPEEAQAAWMAGQVQLVPGTTINMVHGETGELSSIPAERVNDAMHSGQWSFASREQVAAEIAKGKPIQSALIGVGNALTMVNGVDLLAGATGGYDPEYLAMRDSTAGQLGFWGANVGMLAGPAVVGGLTRASAVLGARAAGETAAALTAKGAQAATNIVQRGVQAGLAPAMALDTATMAATEAGAKVLGGVVGEKAAGVLATAGVQGAVGAGIGSIASVSEEMLGNPDANVDSIWAAGASGALMGFGLGAGIGTAVHGLVGGAKAAKAGTAAWLDRAQMEATMRAQGMDLPKDSTRLGKILDSFSEFTQVTLPGMMGNDVEALKGLRTAKAQKFLREREAITNDASRQMSSILDDVVAHQTRTTGELGRVRPDIVAEHIGPAAGGAAVSRAGVAFDTIRQKAAAIVAEQEAIGLGEGALAKKARAQLTALDEAEKRVFDITGMPRNYEYEVSVPVPESERFMREGAAQKPAIEMPVAAEDRATMPPPRPGEERAPGRVVDRQAPSNELGVQEELKFGIDDPADAAFTEYDPNATTRLGVDQVGAGVVSKERRVLEGRRTELPEQTQQDLNVWGSDEYKKVRADQLAGSGQYYELSQRLERDIEKYGDTAGTATYRGLSFTPEDAESLVKKMRARGEWIEPTVHSWSSNIQEGFNFANQEAGKVGVLFRSKAGKVKGLPAYTDENELLARSGKYKVLDISKNEYGNYTVLVEPTGGAAKGAPASVAAHRKELGNRLSKLPADVQADLGAWSGSGSDELRAAQRGGQSGRVTEQAKRLESAIAARGRTIDVPLHRGLTMRGADADAAIASMRSTGKWNEPSLHSWSASPAEASQYAHMGDVFPGKYGDDPRGIVFVVEPGSVKGLPGNISESELVANRAGYDVKNITQGPDGTYTVQLTPGARGEQVSLDAVARKSVKRGQWGLSELGDRIILPETAGPRTFEVLDTLRSAFARGKSKEPEIAGFMDDAVKVLNDALTDRQTWGRAADFQGRISGAVDSRDAAFEVLKKALKFDENTGKFDAAAVRDYMSKMTNVRGDKVREALDSYIQATVEVGDVSDKFYRGGNIGRESRELANRFGTLNNDMREAVQVYNWADGLVKQERTRRYGTNNSLGFAANTAVLGLSSALGIPGALGALAAGNIVSSILYPGSRAIQRANVALVKDQVAAGVVALAKSAVESAGTKAGKVAASLPSLGRVVATTTTKMIEAKSRDERAKAYAERLEELSTLSDPRAYQDHTQRQLGDYMTNVPNHATALSIRGSQAIAALNAAVPPKQSGTGLFGVQPRPSDAKILEFALADRALQDPLGALAAAAERGILLPAERNAIMVASPTLFTQFQNELAGNLDNTTIDSKRLRFVESVLGVQNPQALIAAQAVHQEEQQGGQGGKGTPPPTGANNPNLAASERL